LIARSHRFLLHRDCPREKLGFRRKIPVVGNFTASNQPDIPPGLTVSPQAVTVCPTACGNYTRNRPSKANRSRHKILIMVIGFLFFYAGATKVTDVPAFAADIMAYGLTGYKMSFVLASVFPYIEILTGIFLVTGFQKKPAMAIVILLMGVFSFSIIYGLFVGLDINCGCFSDNLESSLLLSFFRNLFILSLACVLFFKMES
jgi:uncharacterized membrane protein YphA (DoxX/SURF4 family)